MAVVGNTTAIIATISYIPPFSYYTSTNTSYIGGPTSIPAVGSASSTTSTAGSPSATGPVNPVVPDSTNDLTYIQNYLGVHGLSTPSYRPAIFLWFALLAIILLFSLCHLLGFRIGLLGATASKLLIGRKVFRNRTQPKPDAGFQPNDGTKVKKPNGRSVIMPSYGQVLIVVGLSVAVALACVLGSDYINPNDSVFDLTTSFPKRASNGITLPQYNIDKALWTSGSRFGLIAFALFPLVILFALKAPPFALLSLKAFTHLWSDKLALLHKWTGRIIWLITSIHVVLWTVQLFRDQRGNDEDRSVWRVMWIYSNFKWAVVGYVAMTGLIVFSLKKFRQKVYEVFYGGHVVLTILTLLGSLLHYPRLWYWIAIAAFLWAGERTYRFIRFGWHNGWFGGLSRDTGTIASPKFMAVAREENDPIWSADLAEEENGYGMKGLGNYRRPMHSHTSSEYGLLEKSLPTVPKSATSFTFSHEFGGRPVPGANYDVGSLDPKYNVGSNMDEESNDSGHSTRNSTPPPIMAGYLEPMDRQRLNDTVPGRLGSSAGPDSFASFNSSSPLHASRDERQTIPFPQSATTSSQTPRPSPLQAASPVIIPPGYAHAQLLPSRTVRLTIRVPRPFKWHPGQHVLLYIPEISRWQSHPFSILSAWSESRETEIVLLVKARKGFTAKLYELVRKKVYANSGLRLDNRQSLKSMASMAQQPPPVILLRALVDGPFGSAARSVPGRNETLLIVCGGSGVSFGISGLQSFCERIASRTNGLNDSKFRVKTLRFVWVVREFAEIAWASAMLKRCIEMVPTSVLRVDIFVTNARPGDQMPISATGEEFSYDPPKPMFAKDSRSDMARGRTNSNDSLFSQMSVDPSSELPYVHGGQPEVPSDNTESATMDVLEFTNYEDEEEVEPSVAQQDLSRQLKKEGRKRRARSRIMMRGVFSGRKSSQADQPRPASGMESRSQTPHPLSAGPAEEAHRRNSSFSADPPPQNNSRKKRSMQSFASSTFGRYDPFENDRSGGASSPLHSMYDQQSTMEDPAQSYPQVRSNSMFLLQGGGGEKEDAGIWLGADDYESMLMIAEFTRLGRPMIDEILSEEVEACEGTVGVGTCGPASLNAVVRNTVAAQISLKKIMHGDKRGIINLFSEDYES